MIKVIELHYVTHGYNSAPTIKDGIHKKNILLLFLSYLVSKHNNKSRTIQISLYGDNLLSHYNLCTFLKEIMLLDKGILKFYGKYYKTLGYSIFYTVVSSA